MQIPMTPLKGVRIHECVGRSSPLGRGRREAPGEGCRFGQVSSNLSTLTLPSPRGRGFMTVYPMARVSTLGMLGKFAAALVAVVVIQGVFSFKFKVFGFFDLPLIFSVYYGFTLGNPVASIVIGSSLGLMQDSLSGAVLGANGLSKTLIGFFAATAGSKFAVDQPIARIFALFLFTIGDVLLVTILGLMVNSTSSPPYGGAFGGWLLSATLNTLLGLGLFGYYDRWSNATT